MQSLNLHRSASKDEPVGLAQEVARLESLLAGRGVELTALQEEFRAFKARYAQTVGSRLAELSEVECEIRKAEERLLGVKSDAGAEDGEEDAGRAAFDDGKVSKATPAGSALRKLFWSVARMFHPDHSKDEGEARRRHAIMAEASRAYREGDLESLHTLLGDEELRSFCAAAHAHDEEEDLAARLLRLREELITIEFGFKRIRQDALYRLKLRADEEAAHGRDALAGMAERVARQIVKARHRLAHLT